MKRVPIYNVRTWRIRRADDHEIVLWPTLKTAAIRLQLTLLCAVLIVGLHFTLRSISADAGLNTPPLTDAEIAEIARQEQALLDSMRRDLGDEFMDSAERELKAGREARAAERAEAEQRRIEIDRWIQRAAFATYAFLAAAGTLWPLSCLWARVAIRRSASGGLSVNTRGFLVKHRSFDPARFDRVRTYAMERIWFGRHGAIAGHAWDWFVQLAPPGLAYMPVAMDAAWATSREELPPQFLVHRQRRQPGTKDRAPEPVRDFVKALRALTSLPADPPQIIDARLSPGIFRRRITRSMPADTIDLPITNETRTYTSIDEMPKDIREQLAGLLRSGDITRHDDGTIEAVSSTTHTVDITGGELDPDQLSTLPPEVRRAVEDILRSNKQA